MRALPSHTAAFLQRRARFAPLLVALLSLILHFGWDWHRQPRPNIDSQLYLELADNLRAGRGFVVHDRVTLSVPAPPSPRVVPSALRTPGYPLFLIAFLPFVTIIQPLFDLAVVLLTWRAALAVTGRPALAVGAMFVVATHIPTIDISRQVMAESLFALLVAAGFWLVWRAGERGGSLVTLAAALLIGVAPIVRPIGIGLPVIAFLWLAWRRRRALGPVILFLLIAAAPTAGWMLRNQRCCGAPVLDAIAGENALFFRAAQVLIVSDRGPVYALTAMHRESDFFYRLVHIRPALLRSALAEIRSHGVDPLALTYAQRSAWFARIGGRINREHPLYALLIVINGVGKLFLDSWWEAGAHSLDYRDAQLYFVPLTILVLAACGYGVRELWRTQRPLAILAALFILYFVALSAEPAAEPRFTTPFAPMLALFAGAGVDRFVRGRGAGSAGEAPAATTVA